MNNALDKKIKAKDLLGLIPDALIGNLVGITRERVRQIRTKLGIKRYPLRWLDNDHKHRELCKLIGKIPDTEVSDITGISTAVIGKIRRDKKIRSVGSRKERIYDHEKIIKMRMRGYAPRDIAEKYGCALNTINYILHVNRIKRKITFSRD